MLPLNRNLNCNSVINDFLHSYCQNRVPVYNQNLHNDDHVDESSDNSKNKYETSNEILDNSNGQSNMLPKIIPLLPYNSRF